MAKMGEIRRVYSGSTYWLRKSGSWATDAWIITADGVALGAPKPRAQALADLDAVAPVEADGD